MKIKIKNLWIIAVLLIAIISVTNIGSILVLSQARKNIEIGKIKIKVLDSLTGKSIENARVCVIENYEYYTTNQKGETPVISIVKKSSNIKTLQTQTITLLCYKQGYLETIYFNVKIYAGTTRLGMIINLKPIISNENEPPLIEFEKPTKEQIELILNQYKK